MDEIYGMVIDNHYRDFMENEMPPIEVVDHPGFRLSGRTLRSIRWVLSDPSKKRAIMVPNEKRKQDILLYCRANGIDLEGRVVVAGVQSITL